jgi:hypothetical protein
MVYFHAGWTECVSSIPGWKSIILGWKVEFHWFIRTMKQHEDSLLLK